MNRAQLGLWGAIASIFLLAIFGIRSAADWLTRSTPNENAEPTLTITGNQADGNGADEDFAARENSPIAGTRTEDSVIRDRNGDRISAQTGEPSNQQAAQQTSTLTFSPLEEAGTYIQRQKSVANDAIVAATPVQAVPLASNSPVVAQSDSQTAQPAPSTVTNNQPSQARPASASPAVPALW